MEERKTYTVKEVMLMLGMGSSAIYLAIHTGDIPSIRVSGKILIPKARFDRWLENGGKP